MDLVRAFTTLGPATGAASPRSATTTVSIGATSTSSRHCGRDRRRSAAGGGGHFRAHPREYFEGAAARRGSRRCARNAALAAYGVDRVVVLRFDDRMRGMAAASSWTGCWSGAWACATSWWGTTSTSPAVGRALSRPLRAAGNRARVYGGGGRAVPGGWRARQQFPRARGAQPRRSRAGHAPARAALPHGRAGAPRQEARPPARVPDGQPGPASKVVPLWGSSPCGRAAPAS